ncbi:uncharacterized protein K441DRAFT_656735 [Cenococcum geophilum 1.58]|uniref:uncharacterized protein n=1 Tax=Cenococcum geophilum 1.58 TaxID=794803 RepID=UPI00358FEDEF|nr:hypothetical protein K441DRAFT_656735 [Cenococcum geophilum 1.58]
MGLWLKLVSSNTYDAQPRAPSSASNPYQHPQPNLHPTGVAFATFLHPTIISSDSYTSKTVTKRGWHHLCRDKSLILYTFNSDCPKIIDREVKGIVWISTSGYCGRK